MTNINTLLFDLGGVLIELGPVEDMMTGSPLNPKDIWDNWVNSRSVRLFESGNCTAEEFGEHIVAEFGLTIDAETFLDRFNEWPKGTLDGAEDLLRQLSEDYFLACLSNTNIAHYESFLMHQPIMSQFDATFLSHQIGIMKPEPAAFENVLNQLGASADEIVFFDDNHFNVKAAQAMGLTAFQVNSPEDVKNALNGL